jgi:hypothetical protein
MKKYLSSVKNIISSNFVRLKTFGILLVFVFTSVLSSFSQNNCGGNLSAEFKRTIKTITDSKATFTLLLKNTDLVTHEYTFKNINDNVSNPDGLKAEPKVSMNSVLLDTTMSVLTKISLAPGEQTKFFLRLTLPEKTPFDSWNCTQVTAETIGCSPVKIELFAFYPNPDNRE